MQQYKPLNVTIKTLSLVRRLACKSGLCSRALSQSHPKLNFKSRMHEYLRGRATPEVFPRWILRTWSIVTVMLNPAIPETAAASSRFEASASQQPFRSGGHPIQPAVTHPSSLKRTLSCRVLPYERQCSRTLSKIFGPLIQPRV
jgi:hypothetical protein